MSFPINILVTEDDMVLKRFYKQALESECREVTIVEEPGAAMSLLEEKSFDFLITDLLFSRQTGLDIIKKAVQVRPGIIILVASGHVTDNHYHGEMLEIDNIKGYLQKPFTIHELHEKIDSILSDGDGSPNRSI